MPIIIDEHFITALQYIYNSNLPLLREYMMVNGSSTFAKAMTIVKQLKTIQVQNFVLKEANTKLMEIDITDFDREKNELIINLINYRQNNPDSIIWKPQRHFYV